MTEKRLVFHVRCTPPMGNCVSIIELLLPRNPRVLPRWENAFCVGFENSLLKKKEEKKMEKKIPTLAVIVG